MKIHIEGTVYLESDENQVIVRKYSEKPNEKTGAYSFQNLGYFPRVEQAAKFIVDMKIRQSDATTFEQLLADVAEIRAFIASKIDF